MSKATERVLIIALSGRALARSAYRGGYSPVVLDGFADIDTCAHAHRCVRVRMEQGRFDEADLLDKAQMLTPSEGCAGLIYGAGLESSARLLEQLASGRVLYGNPPDIVATVNDPKSFFGLLDELSIPHPDVQFAPSAANNGWLVKRAGASGGWHVDSWRGTSVDTPGSYFQQWIEGQAMSALFLADGNDATVIGFNTLWTQQNRPTSSFAYGGAINRAELRSDQRRKLRRTILDLVRTLGLRGLNSLDFIKQGEQCWVLEINPRPSATFELYDPDVAGGLLSRHMQASQGHLPLMQHWRSYKVRAHSIVYALSALQIPHDLHWPVWCTDRPYGGTRIACGEPVCGVFAEGHDSIRVNSLVKERQAKVLTLLNREYQAA